MSVFLFTLKRQLRSPLNYIFLLLLPLALAFLANTMMSSDLATADFDMTLHVVDNDQTEASRALVEQLRLRFAVQEAREADSVALLTEQKTDYVLRVGEGFESGLLAGEVGFLEGTYLALSEASSMAEAAIENTARALLLLLQGAEKDSIVSLLSQWGEIPMATLSNVSRERDVSSSLQWLTMYSMVALFASFFITRPMLEDKLSGVYARIGASPLPAWAYMLQILLASFLLLYASALFFLALMRGSGFPLPDAPYLLIDMAALCLFCEGLMVMIFSLAKSSMAAGMALAPAVTLFCMLGGAFWPVDIMPEAMQTVARFTPLYWFIQALSDRGSAFVLAILVLLGYALLMLLFGSWRRIRPEV